MNTDGPGNLVIGVVLGLLVLALAILVVGLILRGRGHLRDRKTAWIWAIVTVAPLAVGGIAFYANHRIEDARGLTRNGFDTPANRFAP